MKLGSLLALGALALAPPTIHQERDPAPSVRFSTVYVVLDSGDSPLAAWQVEIEDPAGRARFVGIEGGEHPAFADPPRYDPRALAGDRLVLATFSLDADVPAGRTRVATLHLEVRGDEPVHLTCEVQAAADPRGREITPAVEVIPSSRPGQDR